MPCSVIFQVAICDRKIRIGRQVGVRSELAPKFQRAETLAKAVDRMGELKSFGVATFVDPCPMDLGRDVEFMAEVAQRSGMQIICATGAYKKSMDKSSGSTSLRCPNHCAHHDRVLGDDVPIGESELVSQRDTGVPSSLRRELS